MSPAPARPELAIASAAAHDLNEELTVIVNAAALALDELAPSHPARPLLIELQQAAQRCAWKTSGLLNYSARKGARAVNVPMERLILEAA
jgi:signal transduction histidine kinase